MSIPKIIHYCWFGGGKKSELMERCIASWRKFAKDCEIIEWNESNYDVTKNTYMRQAYEAKRWSFVSDYARLDIVYEHGGIYLDTDVELIRPIDELLEGDGFIGFEQADRGGLYAVNTGGGFGARQGDQVVGALRDCYGSLSFYRSDMTENLQPCPLYNTQALKALGLKCDNSLQTIGNITVYPWEFFCPVDWRTHRRMTTPNTFSIHHFDASWLSENEKKKRKRQRQWDIIVHTPNRIMRKLLGKNVYERIRDRIQR